MEKSQAMCFDACLPPSWWEFTIMHAVHLYNHTPSRRLNWKMPYEMLHNETPDVSHLRVLGCGAYVYLPEERRANKLAPRSELMTFIGIPTGVKGYQFMRSPNNVIFTATMALFDETLFPRCPDAKRRGLTPVGDDLADDNDPRDPNIPSEGEDSDGDDLPRINPRYPPSDSSSSYLSDDEDEEPQPTAEEIAAEKERRAASR